MKGIFIFSICAVIASSQGIGLNKNGCPLDPYVEKLIPHRNCNQFYQCHNGELIAHTCAEGTYYNPESLTCDWPENVDCAGRIITGDKAGSENNGNLNTVNDDPSKAPEICAAEGSDSILVAHENCNKFYKCYNGAPVAFYCPANLFYNALKEACDWPNNVHCGNRLVPDGEDRIGVDNDNNSDNSSNYNDSNNISEAASICAAEDSDGILVAHENCNQFYKCFNGQPVAMYCPGKLLYNTITKQCDWADNVSCGDRNIPDKNYNNDGASNDNIDSNSDTNDDIVINDSDNSGNDVNINIAEAASICAAEASDGTLVAHENCNQFYKCFNGQPVAMYCPGKLLYNPVTKQCDWVDNVSCGDRNIPDKKYNNDGATNDNFDSNSDTDNDNKINNSGNDVNTNIAEAESICAGEGSDGILVPHENCNQFYKCFNGHPVAMYCPGNLLYNPVTKQCDWANNVNCRVKIIRSKNYNSHGAGNDNIDN